MHRIFTWAMTLQCEPTEPGLESDEFLTLLADNGGWISSLELDCSDELTAPLIHAGLVESLEDADRGRHFSLTDDGYKKLRDLKH
jgi:hypothetical protein